MSEIATEGDADVAETDVLPDEAAVLPERGRLLDETDEADLRTVDEAADTLGIDLE